MRRRLTGSLVAWSVLLTMSCGGAQRGDLGPVPAATDVAPQPCTLAPASCRALAQLTAPTTLTAYVSAHSPLARTLAASIQRYAQASGGRVRAVVVSTDTQEGAAAAAAAGIEVVTFQTITDDTVQSDSGQRGLVIEVGAARRVLSVVASHDEAEITSALLVLAGPHPVVGILSGHGGPTIARGLMTLQRMLPRHELREVEASTIGPDVRALLVIDPRTSLRDDEIRAIEALLHRGGSLGVFAGGAAIDLHPRLAAQPSQAHLDPLLAPWGITIGGQVVADSRCGRIPMQNPGGTSTSVPYPPAPIFTPTSEQRFHPILANVESTPVFFASPITVPQDFEDRGGAILLQTHESALLDASTEGVRIREPSAWSPPDGWSHSYVVAVATDAPVPNGSAPSRLFVIGASSLVLDDFLPQQGQLADRDIAGAMAMTLNAIDWLTHEDDVLALRVMPDDGAAE